MITDYFKITEKSNRLQVIMITDYDYPISATPVTENRPEEVQGATASSHIPPPLLQDRWPCVQLLRAELHASETWPLTKTNLKCLQGNDRAMIRQMITDLQYQARGCDQGKVKRATGKASA